MTYNIHHGAGNDDCITPPGPPGGPPTADCGLNLERIATGIREANVDVAGLQEVDRFWARSGGVDQAAALGAMLFAALSDAWAIAGSGPGFTSPASPREAPRNRIDYVLASRGVTVKAAAVRATPHTALASDHYPIVADLTIELPRAASSARRQLHD